MSGQGGNFGNAGKKAVHVKWAGKTIALGTFPAAEADEKCARAKALTRAWRSTMRPKPSRDWVMLELERLGVRVVSGRLGRKAGDEEEEKKPGPALGLDSGDPMPPHRPLVGGGAAAAYEAARADHYAQKREEQQRRASSLGLGMGGGNLGGGSGMPQMGLSVNPNQHYEMLKLHHMNLLNEIQETTLMMNLYQQQQLQQQQQQLQQQQASVDGGGDQMAMLLQQQGGSGGGIDSIYGGGSGLSARGSLGLGLPAQSNDSQIQMLRQQQLGGSSGGAAAGGAKSSGTQQEILKGQQEQAALEEKLKKLKEDIAKRQKEAEDLEKAASGQPSGGASAKRDAQEGLNQEAKRAKVDNGQSAANKE